MNTTIISNNVASTLINLEKEYKDTLKWYIYYNMEDGSDCAFEFNKCFHKLFSPENRDQLMTDICEIEEMIPLFNNLQEIGYDFNPFCEYPTFNGTAIQEEGNYHYKLDIWTLEVKDTLKFDINDYNRYIVFNNPDKYVMFSNNSNINTVCDISRRWFITNDSD